MLLLVKKYLKKIFVKNLSKEGITVDVVVIVEATGIGCCCCSGCFIICGGGTEKKEAKVDGGGAICESRLIDKSGFEEGEECGLETSTNKFGGGIDVSGSELD